MKPSTLKIVVTLFLVFFALIPKADAGFFNSDPLSFCNLALSNPLILELRNQIEEKVIDLPNIKGKLLELVTDPHIGNNFKYELNRVLAREGFTTFLLTEDYMRKTKLGKGGYGAFAFNELKMLELEPHPVIPATDHSTFANYTPLRMQPHIAYVTDDPSYVGLLPQELNHIEKLEEIDKNADLMAINLPQFFEKSGTEKVFFNDHFFVFYLESNGWRNQFRRLLDFKAAGHKDLTWGGMDPDWSHLSNEAMDIEIDRLVIKDYGIKDPRVIFLLGLPWENILSGKIDLKKQNFESAVEKQRLITALTLIDKNIFLKFYPEAYWQELESRVLEWAKSPHSSPEVQRGAAVFLFTKNKRKLDEIRDSISPQVRLDTILKTWSPQERADYIDSGDALDVLNFLRGQEGFMKKLIAQFPKSIKVRYFLRNWNSKEPLVRQFIQTMIRSEGRDFNLYYAWRDYYQELTGRSVRDVIMNLGKDIIKRQDFSSLNIPQGADGFQEFLQHWFKNERVLTPLKIGVLSEMIEADRAPQAKELFEMMPKFQQENAERIARLKEVLDKVQ